MAGQIPDSKTDIYIKTILAASLSIMYGLVFIKYNLDIATLVTLVSGFTNTLVGFFTYNIVKRRVQRSA